MKTKNILPIVLLLILIEMTSLLNAPSTSYGQQPSSTDQNTIPSDLSLDIALAKQNPAPDQQAIVNAEVKQAIITTTTGISTTVQPQDTIAPEVRTEPVSAAIHPEQTTSEQVISTPVIIDVPVNQNSDGGNQPTGAQSQNGDTTTGGNQPAGQPQNGDTTTGGNQPTGIQSQNSDTNNGTVNQTGANNFVPGTTVPQPNDNAAPADNSSNPNLPGPTSTDTTTSQPASPDNAQPPVYNSVPQSNPPTDSSTPQSNPPADNPPADNPPASTDNSTPAVQGAVRSPNPIQILLGNIGHFFTGK